MANGAGRRFAIKLNGEAASTYYNVPVNPVSFDTQDSTNIKVEQTAEGHSVEMIATFDGRPRVMEWKNLPNRTPYSTMVTQLKTYIGKTCQIKLNYLALTGSTDTVAINVRVIDVATSIKSGTGPSNATSYAVYDTLRLSYVLVNI
jgi:hypothetical protein